MCDEWHDSWCGHGYAYYMMEKEEVYFPAVPLIITFWEEDDFVDFCCSWHNFVDGSQL